MINPYGGVGSTSGNESPTGIVGGMYTDPTNDPDLYSNDPAKRRMAQLKQSLAKLNAYKSENGDRRLGTFGLGVSQGMGHNGASAPLSFNPYLAMVAGRPNEVFSSAPAGIPQSVIHAVQNSGSPMPGGGPQLNADGSLATDATGAVLGLSNAHTPGLQDPGLGVGGTALSAPSPSPGAGVTGGLPIGINNPLYHTLLQLQMYGQDR